MSTRKCQIQIINRMLAADEIALAAARGQMALE
jgi:hypothetical protein